MSTIVAVLGLASSAGINAYATLLVLGLTVRTGLVPLDSPTARFFAEPWVLAVVGALYLVEFFADKVPVVDHVWDAVHTFIRPVAGAAASVAVVSGQGEGWVVLAALLGGVTSLLFHGAKATGRVAVSTATGGTANWIVSLAEDAGAFVTAALALVLPLVALAFVGALALWLVGRRRRAAVA